MNITKLVVSIAIPLIAGFIGSLFTTKSIPNWYATIQKPAFNPPNWIFGPVWTTLFIMMGIALYLVWTSGKLNNSALWIFGIQLGLNALWSILFFGLHSPLWAFVDIIALWFAILATIISFYSVSATASYLLVPYILWVSFATILNWKIMVLN
jgi:tryptophan-rich sensory protein